MNKLYKTARRLRDNGHDVSVDHKIPLKGEKVSGLHVPDNLQIMQEKPNVAKGNKYIIE